MSQPGRPRTVRASELSLYGFCGRAWWLAAVRGVPPENRDALEGGVARHEAHAGTLRQAELLGRAGALLAGLGGLLALGWLFLAWLG